MCKIPRGNIFTFINQRHLHIHKGELYLCETYPEYLLLLVFFSHFICRRIVKRLFTFVRPMGIEKKNVSSTIYMDEVGIYIDEVGRSVGREPKDINQMPPKCHRKGLDDNNINSQQLHTMTMTMTRR